MSQIIPWKIIRIFRGHGWYKISRKKLPKSFFPLSFMFFYLVLKKYLPPRVSLSNTFQNIPKYFYTKETLTWVWHSIKKTFLTYLGMLLTYITRDTFTSGSEIHSLFCWDASDDKRARGGSMFVPRWIWLCFALLVYLFYIRASLWQGTISSLPGIKNSSHIFQNMLS